MLVDCTTSILLSSFKIIDRFDFYRAIIFAIHIDIHNAFIKVQTTII
jgi:hypothetical protein